MIPAKFTYPFCYTPCREIVEASQKLIGKIASSPELDALFSEGKMLGVMMVETPEGGIDFLNAFSGVAGGKAVVEGFVPPIFDLTVPDGHYKLTEAKISALNHTLDSLGADDTAAQELKAERKRLSIGLQEWIFEHYIVSNALGESLSIREVFALQGLVPPGGTGDCAAPKMLQYAYLHSLRPLAMGEFWYGASPSREIRRQGSFYPSCTGKCGPLLTWMMRGLDVEPNPLDADREGYTYETLYEDDTIIVVNKPEGLLSVPGKTLSRSLLEMLQQRYGPSVYSCHRLDMDTSGLMVYARTLPAKSALERQFAEHTVSKRYTARLISSSAYDGPLEGIIRLPLMLDYYDRPRQMVSLEEGKEAVTEFKILSVHPNGEMDVAFTPLTGRTHQLRVHAAHPAGLGRPIKGDRLYGAGDGGRLHLHASHLSFTHPVTGEQLSFDSPAPFIG